MFSNKYKILCTADIHGNFPIINTSFDLLLLGGDLIHLYLQRNPSETCDWFETVFVNWINSLPFKNDDSKVIWIAGNHEVGWEKLAPEGRLKIADYITNQTNGRAIYLEDMLYDFNGIKIYGTPWCKIFNNWGFMKSDEDLKRIYEKIPENLDILLTHDAPYGTSDLCYGWYSFGRTPIHIGNEPLRDAILEKKPKYNIHGHLHSANHEKEILGTTSVYCVSLVDEEYRETYSPLQLEIVK